MTGTPHRRSLVLAIAALLIAASPAAAQIDLRALEVDRAGGRPPDVVVTVKADFTQPAGDKPGRLFITAEIAGGWHIYSITQKPGGPIKSKIKLDESKDFKLTGDFKPFPNFEKHVEPAFNNLDVETHEGKVTWYAPLELAPAVDPKQLKITGKLSYQACNDSSCLPPDALKFEAKLGKGVEVDKKPTGAGSENKSSGAARAIPVGVASQATPPSGGGLDLARIQVQGDDGQQSLPLMLGFALLGGLILNLMPCVLPVIGLKILGFVEQSGQSRRHVFLLNWWFSLGLLAVFVTLATILIGYRIVQGRAFGWGEQNSFDAFNITMTAIVFVMALSLLGVWEIPIPGFLGSGKSGSLAAKEGAAGAFLKGAITTVLAIPCTGPFLGTAVVFAANKPPAVVYLMFVAMGLGMASPYLLIGAFPRLIRFLPKPGAWMDTFKQLMGFVLLATVVYLLTLVQWPAVIPTLALLIGLWAACWWIGRTPVYAELDAKLRAWAGGGLLALAVGVVAFLLVGPVMQKRFDQKIDGSVAKRIRESQQIKPVLASDGNQAESVTDARELPWQPFSTETLTELTRQHKTVMVDFTADWCVTCKALEKFVLNTADTYDFVTANGIVPLVADMTRYPDDETKLLGILNDGGLAVPVLAIFPAGRPNKPIVLRDGYTRGTLLEKLREAGPSKKPGEKAAVAAIN